MRWWCGGCGCGGGGAARRGRMLCALLVWAALCALLLPALTPPRAAPPAPAAHRALLQSASTPPPAASTRAAPPAAPAAPAAPARDESEREAMRRLPSLPLEYWLRHHTDAGKFYEKKECAPLPSVYELEFSDTYWQTLRTDEGTFHLWGAYLDVRNASRLGPAVRLLAVHDRVKPRARTHCQLWFEGRAAPVLVRVLEYKYVWHSKWGNYRDGPWQPFLLACVLPPAVRALVPAAVSLVAAPCARARTLLRVTHEPADAAGPGGFAVCVKGLDFLHADLSARLVEWLELLRLLGAERVHLYTLQVHANVSRVLRHYTARNFTTVTPLTLPGGAPNVPGLQHLYLKAKTTNKRQLELVPYNDCLYRHMYRWRWLALLDVDEVIVPLQDDDWPALMARVLPLARPAAGKPPRSSYHASNLYFLDSLQPAPEPGVPGYLHMTGHVWRTRNFTKPGQYVKAFHETARVLAVHNHFPLACLGGACSSYALEPGTARLQHYRADCVSALKSCAALRADAVRDLALWRWRDRLQPRVEATLRELGLLPMPSPQSQDTHTLST